MDNTLVEQSKGFNDILAFAVILVRDKEVEKLGVNGGVEKLLRQFGNPEGIRGLWVY